MGKAGSSLAVDPGARRKAMDRAVAGTSQGLYCPACATDLNSHAPTQTVAGLDRCPHCGEPLEPSGQGSGSHRTVGAQQRSHPVGGVVLVWRNWMLRLLERIYWLGAFAGSALMLAFGGFVPVGRRWLSNEIGSWSDIVATLGGVWFPVVTQDPDSDLGPVVARVDAPLLFSTIDTVGRRLGVKPPGQVRLTYLPCCGVVAWGRSRALLIGLPLFRVLTQGELRAIVAHELAHLARGDATRAARSVRFVEGLERAVEHRGGQLWGPLGAWARLCLREAAWLIEPVSRGQEARADRCAAAIAGGGAASSALVKVAVVQPLFREVLSAYNPNEPGASNLYAFFRSFWYRLPADFHSSMRMNVLASRLDAADPTHPPLPDRVASLQSYPDRPNSNGDALPATTFLGDLEVFEEMLHNRLFNLPVVEPSVFHKNGS
jgi:hypothetical protein